MKSLAILAAAACVLLAGSWNATASSPSATHRSITSGGWRFDLPLAGQPIAFQHTQPQAVLRQATSTATATPVPGTATPTATATTATATPAPTQNPSYPDPLTLLQEMYSVYNAINSTHVVLTTQAETSTQKLVITGTGDATCSGASAMQLKVNAVFSLKGTSQSQKQSATYIQVGQKKGSKISFKTEVKKSGKTATWQKQNPNKITFFGFPYLTFYNPLNCPYFPQSSGGSSDVPGHTVNLGPETINGQKVWHIQFPITRTTSTGDTVTLLDDFYVGQDHFLPFRLQQTVNDTADGILVTLVQDMTKIGEKVKVKYHKLGTK